MSLQLSVDGKVQQLVDELTKVMRARLPEIYKDKQRQDELRFPCLTDIIRSGYPQRWRDDPTGALIVTLRLAVGGLSQERAHGGKLTWQQIGEYLCGFRVVLSSKDSGDAPTYKDYIAAVRYHADLEAMSATSFRNKILKSCRIRLAVILLDMPLPRPLVSDLSQPTSGPEVLERRSYIDQIVANVEDGHRIIFLWGEAGVGKSILAGFAAAEVSAGSAVAVLHCGNPGVLRGDILDSLVAAGLEPETWSSSYCQAALRRVLLTESNLGAVVVDNIDSVDELWTLVPKNPRVPVLVTGRQCPDRPGIAAVEVSELTEAEARYFVQGRLATAPAGEVERLIDALGYRPLALDHAIKFLMASEMLKPADLIEALALSVRHGLSLVEIRIAEERRLVSLYRTILEAIQLEPAALEVLDAFLVATGRSSECFRSVLSFSLNAMSNGLDYVALEAGLQLLSKYGLLRSEARSWSMHNLTWRVLSELRGPELFEPQKRFLLALAGSPRVRGKDAELDSMWADIYSKAFISSINLQFGWRALFCFDERTWIAVRDSGLPGSRGRLTRYEVWTGGIYAIDCASGRRAMVQIDEARQLLIAMRRYQELVIEL